MVVGMKIKERVIRYLSVAIYWVPFLGNWLLIRQMRKAEQSIMDAREWKSLAEKWEGDAYVRYQMVIAATARADAAEAEILKFSHDIASNWDHDDDAHRYNTSCFVCMAEKMEAKHSKSTLKDVDAHSRHV